MVAVDAIEDHLMIGRSLSLEYRCPLQDLICTLHFAQLGLQPAILILKIVGRFCRHVFAGVLVFAHPGSQCFLAQTKCVNHTDSRPVRGFGVELSNNDELDGTSLEFVGAFHWHEGTSFYQSTCLDYPRNCSEPRIDNTEPQQTRT